MIDLIYLINSIYLYKNMNTNTKSTIIKYMYLIGLIYLFIDTIIITYKTILKSPSLFQSSIFIIFNIIILSWFMRILIYIIITHNNYKIINKILSNSKK